MTGWLSSTTAQLLILGNIPAGCRPPTYVASPTCSGGYVGVRTSGDLEMKTGDGANYFALSYSTK